MHLPMDSTNSVAFHHRILALDNKAISLLLATERTKMAATHAKSFRADSQYGKDHLSTKMLPLNIWKRSAPSKTCQYPYKFLDISKELSLFDSQRTENSDTAVY